MTIILASATLAAIFAVWAIIANHPATKPINRNPEYYLNREFQARQAEYFTDNFHPQR